jgi:hypothetical protein
MLTELVTIAMGVDEPSADRAALLRSRWSDA